MIPYGYRHDPANHSRIIEHHDEQRVINTILILHEEGESLRGIADFLKHAAIWARCGKPFQHCTIRNIIRREEKKP